MRLLRGLHNPGLEDTGCVATIGNFDGVHLGHQAIIRQVLAKAENLGLPSVVIVFEPQPMEFFQGKSAPARLMRFREKLQALSGFGLDYVVCLKFDSQLSNLSAESFIEQILVSHLHIRHLVVGDDFRFGGDRNGDFKLLETVGRSKGFTVEHTPTLIDPDLEAGPRISSTYVRELLAQADFLTARKILGRDYCMTGRVVHGQQLGRQLGFPTANIALHRIKIPFTGVYAVELCSKDGKKYPGVANIGVKPTVGKFLPALEVHLFDFDSNIYGEQVSVTFFDKIRDEQRFENIDTLKQQITNDIAEARRYFTTLI